MINNKRVSLTSMGILTAAGLFLAYAPSASAGQCSATSVGWNNTSQGTATCPAVNPKGHAQTLIGHGNPGDPPTNKQLYVDYYGNASIFGPTAQAWGLNSNGGQISGCFAWDTSDDYYAQDYYGCNSAVRARVQITW